MPFVEPAKRPSLTKERKRATITSELACREQILLPRRAWLVHPLCREITGSFPLRSCCARKSRGTGGSTTRQSISSISVLIEYGEINCVRRRRYSIFRPQSNENWTSNHHSFIGSFTGRRTTRGSVRGPALRNNKGFWILRGARSSPSH